MRGKHNLRSFAVLAAILTGLGWFPAGTCLAVNASYSDGLAHVVNTTVAFIDIHDGGSPKRATTVTSESPADISFVNTYDSSNFISNNGNISFIENHNSSHASVNNGQISHVDLSDQSTVEMHGGVAEHFDVFDQAHGIVYGGSPGFLVAEGTLANADVPSPTGHSIVDVYGGSVGVLRANAGGVVNFYGGTVGDLNPFGGGISNIFGGTMNDMTLNDGSVTNVYGSNLKLTFDSFIFNIPQYRLTGALADGSSINCLTALPTGAVLNLIPEPSTVLLSLIPIAIGLSRPIRRRAPLDWSLAC